MECSDFITALSDDNLTNIKAAEKTDFHCHAFLSTRLENVESWLEHLLNRPPIKMDGLEGMMDYIRTSIAPYLENKHGFEFITESALNDAIQDGVIILEMSFDIRCVKFYQGSLIEFISFVKMLVNRYSDQIDLRPELGFARECAKESKWMKLAHEAIELDLFKSIDLYSYQKACAPEDVQSLYAKARAVGMKLKAHVGEFGGVEEVRRTVEVLDLDEVQHGIAAAESVEIMQWLSNNDIQLNVCPTSNVMLGGVAEMKSHPIRILFDNGVPVTINTDDLMIFGQSVSDEYRNLYQAGVFTAHELDEIRLAPLANLVS